MISTEQLSYHKADRTLSAEVSDLQIEPLPEVIEVFSYHTGVVKRFAHVKTEKDREGDVLRWVYRTDDGLRLVIFND